MSEFTQRERQEIISQREEYPFLSMLIVKREEWRR